MEIPKNSLENNGRFSNRGKVALALGMLPLALVAADRIGGELRWRNRETVVDFYGEKPADGVDSTCIAFSPLGYGSSEMMCEVMEPVMDRPMTYVKLPDKGHSEKAIGEAVGQHLIDNDIGRIGLVNCSMGQSTAFNILKYLPEHIRLDYSISDCSPTDMEHVKMNRAAAEKIAKSRYKGGPITSFGVAAATYRPEPGTQEKWGRTRAGWKRIGPGGDSPMTWTWQLRSPFRTSRQIMSEQVRSRMTPDTWFAYIMPDDPENDGIVDVMGGAEGLEEISGRQVDRLYIPGGAHASGLTLTEEYRHAVATQLKAKGLLDD